MDGDGKLWWGVWWFGSGLDMECPIVFSKASDAVQPRAPVRRWRCWECAVGDVALPLAFPCFILYPCSRVESTLPLICTIFMPLQTPDSKKDFVSGHWTQA